ncbi:MAG: hypothetical protein K6G05_03195 [Lachnospiraceae bacterium]|nr:hypothetical protein [Lachnospiraceae bacterium]
MQIDDSNFYGCTIQYTTDGENWTDLELVEGVAVSDVAALRIQMAEGYTLAAHTALRAGGQDVLQANLETFTSTTGYTLEAGTSYELEHVQFISSTSTSTTDDSPPVNNTSELESMTITVDGTEYTVHDGDTIEIPKASIEGLEFAITKAVVNGTEYSLTGIGTGSLGTTKDDQNRSVLETRDIVKNTGSQWTLGFDYHAEDDTVNTGVPGFGVVQITFTSQGYKGVIITSSQKPDMYDDTVYPSQIDISNTTESKPAKTAVYYDSSDFTVAEVNGTKVKEIKLSSDIPEGAVTISGNKVTFNSGYYATIPLVVTLEDGTVGYLSVDRLGMEIHGTNAANSIIYHGSQVGVDMSTVSGSGTYNIVAVFYYSASEKNSDYNMVATLTYADNTTETKVITGFNETSCIDTSLKGGDYLIWSGDSSSDMPTSVSVTAVKAGATSGDSFAGALFGAGKGVTATSFN